MGALVLTSARRRSNAWPGLINAIVYAEFSICYTRPGSSTLTAAERRGRMGRQAAGQGGRVLATVSADALMN
jgi:hypothetical protein